MNRTILRHLIVWSILMFIDYAGYIPVWHSNTLKIGIVNYAWLLLAFYSTHFVAKSYLNRNSNALFLHITSDLHFWAISFIVTAYVLGTMLCDRFLLDAYYAPTLWTYCLGRIAMVSHFTVAAIFLAIYQNRKQVIARLNKKHEQLELKIESLEVKAIHMSSVIESKEATIRHMDDEIGELQFNAEMLSRDLDGLEATAKAKELQVAEQNLVIQANSEEIERLRKENELLTTSKTDLEQEISNRQNLIVVLKAELIAGLEDYKQLANDYSMKMDLYNDQLSRYRNLYGELGDEDEDY